MSKIALPENFEEYAQARQAGFIKAMEVKERGENIVGTFCAFTPTEILDAAGCHSVSLCGKSDEATAIAEADLPKNLCPLIKSSYGFAVTDKCPYFYFADMILGETTCDGKKKMYELMGKLKFTHVMQLPQTIDDPFSLELWIHEIKKLIGIVEERFGVQITEKSLREAAAFRNELRRAYTALFSLGKLNPPAIWGGDIFKVMEAAGFSFNIRDQLKKIQKLSQDACDSYNHGMKPVPETAKRILVTGCPIGGVLEKTVGAIEANGGVVVCFENCGGVKPSRVLVDLDEPDIISAIAKRYLSIGCPVISPNTNRVNMMRELIEEYNVDGVVDVILQSCHPYNVETNIIKKTVNAAGKPYMSLETDYSQSDTGQLQTRLSAFIEML